MGEGKYMAISQEHIDKFSGILKSILDEELKAGNVIKETYNGWPTETTSIALEKPFKKPVIKNLPGIEFYNINDPHYWKAEYYDKVNHLILTCGFNGPQDLQWEY